MSNTNGLQGSPFFILYRRFKTPKIVWNAAKLPTRFRLHLLYIGVSLNLLYCFFYVLNSCGLAEINCVRVGMAVSRTQFILRSARNEQKYTSVNQANF